MYILNLNLAFTNTYQMKDAPIHFLACNTEPYFKNSSAMGNWNLHRVCCFVFMLSSITILFLYKTCPQRAIFKVFKFPERCTFEPKLFAVRSPRWNKLTLNLEPCAKCNMRFARNCWPLCIPEILLHPFLQLFGDLLFPPFVHIRHKHPGVERAVSRVDAEISHYLFPVVQVAHVGCLWDEPRWEDGICQRPNL